MSPPSPSFRRPIDPLANAGDIVANWPVDEVPLQHPFFPRTPREGPRIGTFGFIAGSIGLGSAVAFFSLAIIMGEDFINRFVGLGLLLIPIGMASLVFAPVCYPLWRNERLWRNARVVPAVVGDIKVGLFENRQLSEGEHQTMKTAFHGAAHFMPVAALPIGALFMALTATRYSVYWIERGERRSAKIFLGFEGTRLEEGRVIWLLVPNRGKPQAALFAASGQKQSHRMPPAVVKWFHNAYLHAMPEDADLQRELKEAARAGSKA